MPYNNSAIAPSAEATGTATLPLARVKKVLNVDEDINQVSNQASFVITKATEMFVQNMAEQAHAAAKADGKSRRTIMYQDVSNIVARNDNLEFLSDIVPRTTTMAELKKQQAIETGYSDPGAARSVPLPPGQTTLDSMRPQSSHMAAQLNATESTSTDRLTTRDHVNGGPTNGAGMLVFEHYEPNGSGKHDGSGDVEMS